MRSILLFLKLLMSSTKLVNAHLRSLPHQLAISRSYIKHIALCSFSRFRTQHPRTLYWIPQHLEEARHRQKFFWHNSALTNKYVNIANYVIYLWSNTQTMSEVAIQTLMAISLDQNVKKSVLFIPLFYIGHGMSHTAQQIQKWRCKIFDFQGGSQNKKFQEKSSKNSLTSYTWHNELKTVTTLLMIKKSHPTCHLKS